VSEWLERLGLTDEEEPAENLAPRVSADNVKLSSPAEFLREKPRRFLINLGGDEQAEFVLVLEKGISLTYIATLKEGGRVKEVDKVEIFYDRDAAKLHASKFRDIVLRDNVLIYSPTFWSEGLREARIMCWSARALDLFCGFRFF